MILPRRLDNIYGNILDSVLTSQIDDLDDILARMAGVYLAIGGDVSLAWDTNKNNKLDIIRDLEEQIEEKLLFTAPLKFYPNIGLSIKHQYGEPGQNKPYRLRVFFEIERFTVFSTDFLADIADKRLHSLLRRVVSMILYNPIFSPINLVDVGDRQLDYLEGMEMEDEVENDVKERVSEEIAFFKKEFPDTKAGAKRIDRLKKIRQTIEKLTDEQNVWLDNVFQYLETVYSSITFDEFWNNGVKMADWFQDNDEDEEDCDNMFNPEYMFFVTTTFGTVYNFHCESVDDDMNCGVACPNFRININSRGDIDKLNLHMRVYGLLGSILDRGGEVWSTTSAK